MMLTLSSGLHFVDEEEVPAVIRTLMTAAISTKEIIVDVVDTIRHELMTLSDAALFLSIGVVDACVPTNRAMLCRYVILVLSIITSAVIAYHPRNHHFVVIITIIP